MAERSFKDLNYGHAGAATYNLETREWTFLRQYTTRKLKQIRIRKENQEVATLAIPKAIRFATPQTSTSTTSIKKYGRGLVREQPPLAPALGMIPEFALLSTAIQSTGSTYDPLVGSLLSFGSITLEGRYETPRRVAALPAGESGNILRLAILSKERHGWAMDRRIWIEGLSLKDADCGYWNDVAAPILQVCFAQSKDRSSFLAVRLPTRTVFFRPLNHRRPWAANRSSFYDLPPSTVDAHPILSLGADQTGAAAHADVTFNPDFQFQFGIVDQNSTWSIWDIEHGRKGDLYTISSSVHGPIDPVQDTSTVGEDGWARILWVGDVNTLLVCNRRKLSIIGIKRNSFAYLDCQPLVVERSPDWILDIKQHPKYRARFFVLTSSQLLLMAVITSNQHLNGTAGETGAKILVSWRHFRGADDLTLRISVQLLTEDDSCVLLHSRLNQLVQIYNFSEPNQDSSAPISSSDPSTLDLSLDGPECIIEIQLEPMQYVNKGDTYDSRPGRSYMERGISFFRMMATRSDLSVHEVLLSTYASASDSSSAPDLFVEDVQRSIVRKARRDFSSKEMVDEEVDFVVDDSLKALAQPVSQSSQTPRKSKVRDEIFRSDRRDYGTFSEALMPIDIDTEGLPKFVDIAVVMDQLKQLLVDDPDSFSLPLGTLTEFAGTQIDVSDVDEASLKLQELLLREDGRDATHLQHIASLSVINLTINREPTITELYDTIVQHWIASLPANIPIRVRQRKERLARRIAMEAMLSIIRIRQPELAEAATASQHGASQGSSISLPILPSKPSHGIHSDGTQWPFTQPLPAPPHLSIPSSSIPPSSTSLSGPKPSPSSNALARLARYLPMLNRSTSPTTIPRSIDHVLAHWQPGSDPRTYDWDAAEMALEPESQDEFSQQQRDKAQKKKARRERRQQREDELMRSKSVSQPALYPRSSPGPVLGGVGSSSQAPSQPYSQVPFSSSGFTGPGGVNILAPQSQIEPGRFGGRPDAKKKKKARVGGF